MSAGMWVLIAVGVALTVVGLYLDRRGITVGWLFGDPRKAVNRAHRWADEGGE